MQIPEGDLLIHAGDGTVRGTEAEVEEFAAWMMELPHTWKCLIPGNHDWLFQTDPVKARVMMAQAVDHVLIEEGCEIEGKQIWGSPWTPAFNDWAFNYPPGDAKQRWAGIPAGLDVLVTHGPPLGIMDTVRRGSGEKPSLYVGCRELRQQVERLQPRFHVFGHIHEHQGSEQVPTTPTWFINASMLDADYRPGRKPIVFHI